MNFAIAKTVKQAATMILAFNVDSGSPSFSASLAVAYQICAAGIPKVLSSPDRGGELDMKIRYHRTLTTAPRSEPKIWPLNKTYEDTFRRSPILRSSIRFAAWT